MVRTYKRKSKRADYSTEKLQKALQKIQAGLATLSQASLEFNIPYNTLYKRHKGLRGQKSNTHGRPPVFHLAEEQRLANYLKCLEKWGYGLTSSEVLEKVREFVTLNNIKTPFTNNRPGTDWLIAFKRRHGLSTKKPQSLEYCRKKATDPFLINEYFQLLKETLDKLKLHNKPNSIWNLDETSLCMDPSRLKVVGAKGKPCSRIIAGSGKENVTVLAGASAAGQKAPPLIIYKGNNVWSSWIPETNELQKSPMSFAASPNGWMTSEIFRNYFTKTLLPFFGDTRPILIVYDGHASHVDSQLIETAQAENVTILKLPAHSSHLLQPLDLSVFRPLKLIWEKKLLVWQRRHQGCKIPKKHFSVLLNETWNEVSQEIISSGFKKGGIYPFNENVVSEEKYDPAAWKRWKEFQKQKDVVDKNDSITATNGQSIEAPEETVKQHNHSPTKTSEDTGRDEGSFSEMRTTSFEELLLQTLKQDKPLQTLRRKRLAPGAEIITCRQDQISNQANVSEYMSDRQDDVITEPNKKKKSKSVCTVYSDTSNSETDIQYSDTDDDYLSSPDEDEIPDLIFGNMKKGQWVLVKYCTKKTVKHFVGQIIRVENGEDITVKFVKKYKSKYVWPELADIDNVAFENIIKLLPEPEVDRRGTLEFKVRFDGYNV